MTEETRSFIGACFMGLLFLVILVGLANSLFIGLPWSEFIPWRRNKKSEN